MGTMELHFRRTKIAWFSCDTNTSQVGGGGGDTTGQNTEAQNIL